MKKKAIALAMALTVSIGCAVGGTLAWLVSSPDEVTNTFSTSNVGVTLTETTGGNNHDGYIMTPGCDIAKDPKVTVTAGSEDCYVFVKVMESDNFDNFMTYTVDSAWTSCSAKNAKTTFYYQKVTRSQIDSGWSDYILTGKNITVGESQPYLNGFVTVKDTVTKTMMNGLTGGSNNDDSVTSTNTYPKLTFQVAAIQLYKTNIGGSTEFTPAEAWAQLPIEFRGDTTFVNQAPTGAVETSSSSSSSDS